MPPPTPPAPVRRATVLVIDGDDGLRGLACLLLASNGFDVTEAADGAEAVRLAAARPGWPDLILADVCLRETVTGRLLVGHPAAKTLFLSGPDLPAGAAALRKPFAPSDLLAEVRAVMAAG